MRSQPGNTLNVYSKQAELKRRNEKLDILSLGWKQNIPERTITYKQSDEPIEPKTQHIFKERR
jgi:hypothetical protein